MPPLIVAIKIRGDVGASPDVRYTLNLLRLRRKHVAVILEASQSILGMLKKVAEYVTWGELDEETLALLLEKRGRLIGNKKITEEYLKSKGFSSFKELAQALLSGKITLKQLPEIKPFFRLAPPSGGFKKTIKKHYLAGGELGYRGSAIRPLIKAMV
ncbi:MAG: 50S ribosomal protein L30 [Candidatus Methanomethylicota archaeon]|uniref:Large ribosomal subunit protein uL30 n=1 Tax=Thermoproteota archaeon TaxID=2056631 RepID=A0A497EZP2_9CREN|nr:MAG: 50S ribosomal protein L30 [Candidatus Verstraetearchaeota archaeon]RLE52529.1 MAG: 50S ribosomal protein L30 [Candidatus Verstraetearchaeota archaeon]